jgi:hypothetical protein
MKRAFGGEIAPQKPSSFRFHGVEPEAIADCGSAHLVSSGNSDRDATKPVARRSPIDLCARSDAPARRQSRDSRRRPWPAREAADRAIQSSPLRACGSGRPDRGSDRRLRRPLAPECTGAGRRGRTAPRRLHRSSRGGGCLAPKRANLSFAGGGCRGDRSASDSRLVFVHRDPVSCALLGTN